MTRYAKLADGRVLAFPDDTPDEVVVRVAKEQTLAASKEGPGFLGTLGDIGGGLVRGTGNLIGSLGSEAVSEAPKIARSLAKINPVIGTLSALESVFASDEFKAKQQAAAAVADKEWAQTVAPVTGAIQGAGKAVANLAPERVTPDWEHSQGFFGGLGSIAVTAAESAPTTLAALATTIATKNPAAGMAVMGTLGGLQTYSGIRQQQKREGIDDVDRALLGTAASTALDVFTGSGGAISKIGRATAKEALEQGMRHIVKEAVKTGGSEGITEMAQNLIEQVAGGADPMTKQNMLQTVEAGLVGALMGTPVGFASAKINAARTEAARAAPALDIVDILKDSPGGGQAPEALDILTVPDKKGAVVVRDAGGNIQTVSIKDIEGMRAPPAEGEEHEPLNEALTRKAQERKDAYEFTKATQDALRDPENQDAIDIIAKRYATRYGLGQEEAVKYAKANIAKARAPQAGTTATEEPGMPEDLQPFAPPEAYADEMGQAAAPTAQNAPPAPSLTISPAEEAADILGDTSGEALRQYADANGIDEEEAISRLEQVASAAPVEAAPIIQPLSPEEQAAQAEKSRTYNQRQRTLSSAESNLTIYGKMVASGQLPPTPLINTLAAQMLNLQGTPSMDGLMSGELGLVAQQFFANEASALNKVAANKTAPVEPGPTGMRYMRGRTPRTSADEGFFGDELPKQEKSRLDKREELEQRKLELTPEERVAQQEQVGAEAEQRIAEAQQRNKEIEQQRIAKVQNDIWAANKANKPYEVRYVPNSPTPYQVVGPEEADGSRELFVAEDNLTDFENAAGDLVPYTSRPLSAQAVEGGREVPNTPYTQINQDLVEEINAARAANKITDSEKAALFQQIVASSNRGGAKKSIEAGEKAYLAAMNDLRNAENDAAKKAAEANAANIASDLRRVANNIVGNPVRARLKTLIETREDEQAGAKQRIGNAKVQEALGRMEGEDVVPEQREQREAAIDLAEAKPTKYMRGEKEAGGPPKVVSVEEAQKAVNAASGAWKGRPNISVVNSIADLPADLRRAMEKDGAQNALGFVAPDGTVYIIADNALSMQDIRAALFHEALGHIGLEKLFRNTLDTALVGMYNNNAKLKADVDAWMAENPDAYKRDKNTLARATEEVFAERSENGRLEVSFFRKIATIIRNFARRMGFKVELTDGDVAAILSMAHDQVVRGKQESTVVKGLRYMTAWHGSPHNFEKFDISKIGSGEGAQVYGWGLYFTDTKQIAEKQYRDRLSKANYMVDGKSITEWAKGALEPLNIPYKSAAAFLEKMLPKMSNPQQLLDVTLDMLKEYTEQVEYLESAIQTAHERGRYYSDDSGEGDWPKAPDTAYADLPEQLYDEYAEVRAELKHNKAQVARLSREVTVLGHFIAAGPEFKTTGKLYQVDIKPEEDDFLLWDKPLTEQSPKVLKALRSLGYSPESKLSKVLDIILTPKKLRVTETGADFYYSLVEEYGSFEAASLALLDAGIRGNKYLDGNSRGPFVEKPTYNYVLFDDSDVSVTNKYMRPKTPQQKINRGVQKAQLSSGATFFEGLDEASQGWIESAKENAEARLEALSATALPKKLLITTTSSILEAIKRMNPPVGDIIAKLDDTEQYMRGMRQSMKKALSRRTKEFEKFVNKYKQEVISGMMTIARVNRVDVTSANSLDELLKNDKAAKLYRGYLTDPSMSPAQKRAYAGHLKNREDDIRAAWAAWEKLGKQPGGQELYKQVRQFYKDMYTALRAEQDENIRAMGLNDAATNRLIAAARGEDSQEDLTDENDRFPGIPQKLFPDEYFPFRRFGNFALVVNAGEGRERERYHFESAHERNKWQDQRAQQLGLKRGTDEYNATFKQLNNQEEMRNSMAGDSAMLGKMFKIINESTLMTNFDATQFATQDQANSAAKEKLKDQLYQTYLMTLPERSLRKQFIHAEKITGNSADALRIFKNAATQYSSQLPKLAYGREAQRLIETAYDTIDKTKRDPAEMAKLRTLVDAYVGRYRETVDPTNGPGKIESITSTYAYFNMLSAAYTAAAQLISVPLQTMPRMSARYGYGQTAKVMGNFMRVWDTAKMFVDVDPATGEKYFTAPSLGNAPVVTNNPLRRRFWDELNNKRDLFSQHYSDMRLRDRRTTVYGTEGALNKLGTGYEQTVQVAGALMSSADQLSREMVGMAFAELHYNKLRKEGVPPEEAFESAVQAAIKNTNDTLGNYTELDKMTALRGGVFRRFIGFLRNYAVQRTKYYFTQLDAITRGSPYQTRRQAFHELMGTVLLGAMAGGVKTIFGYSVICSAIDVVMKSLMSDEEKDRWRREDPKAAFDSDYWFRNVWIPYHFGGAGSMTSKIAKHGALAEMTGADLGPRISQNNLWFRELRVGDTPSGTAANFLTDNLSAKYSQVSQLGDALDDFAAGNMSRGFSKALPAAVRGWVTANRLATEGEVQPSTGRTVMGPEEFTTGDLINQVLGAAPLKLAEVREENRKIIGWKRGMGNERTKLLVETRKMLLAPHTDQDIIEARNKIIAFNSKVPTVPGTNYGDPEYIIEPKDIMQSIETSTKKAEKSIRGVEMSDAQRAYLLQ